jgi:GNAT superfamily N-acetyltransferase
MTIQILNAHQSHTETIAKFNQSMAIETENKTLDWDLILPGVQRLLDEPASGFYLVAVDKVGIDQEQAGNDASAVVACLGVTYEWSDWRNALFWWIQSVYVLPSHRGQGVFSQLYATVKERALEQTDVCGIRLYVEKDNATAQRTYERLGMIETEYRLLEEEF